MRMSSVLENAQSGSEASQSTTASDFDPIQGLTAGSPTELQ